MAFNIAKHEHHEFPTETLKAMVEGVYKYSIEDVAQILDLPQQYIQINFIPKLDTLYLQTKDKRIIRDYLKKYQNGCLEGVETELLHNIHTVNNWEHNTHLLTKRVLISETSLMNLIMEVFMREYVDYEVIEHIDEKTGKKKKKEIKHISRTNLDAFDLQLIISQGMLSVPSIKEYIGLKYDTQLFRFLKKAPHHKFVIVDNSKKNNLARYILDDDFDIQT